MLLGRLPFVSHELAAWDSVLYARALEDGFHVDTQIADERPQPPGYLLYLGLAALVRLVIRDSNAALVAVSVISSTLAAVAVYVFARRLASRGIAAVAALGFAAGPLAWHESEIAMPYALLALVSTSLAALFHRVRAPRERILASLAFGIAAGFRQDLPLLLGPLWIWMLWPAPWRERAQALASAAAACLAWFVPSALLSGGAGAYLESVVTQVAHAGTTFSIVARGTTGFVDNLLLTLYGLGWGLVAFAAVLVAIPLARALAGQRTDLRGGGLFFALWIVPPFAVYVILHIGDPGYVLSIVPGLYVLVAALLAQAAPKLDARTGAVAGTCLVAANALAFVLIADGPFSADAIARHDRSLKTRVAYIRAHYGTSGTIVLSQFEYVFVRHYLPEYRALFYGESPEMLSRTPIPVTVSAQRMRVIVFGTTAELPPGLRRELPLPDEGALATAQGEATLVAYDLEGR